MTEQHPLAAPIDRALDGRIYAGAGSHSAYRARLRDYILAEIEAEFGPIGVEYEVGSGLVAEQQRLSGEWVAKR